MSFNEIEIRDVVRWSMTEPKPMAEPEPEPEPKLVTWQLCVRIEPEEVADAVFHVAWYRSDNIPEDWHSVVPYTQPIETVQQLPEGQRP